MHNRTWQYIIGLDEYIIGLDIDHVHRFFGKFDEMFKNLTIILSKISYKFHEN